ncbi:MAG TPA: hypothetical protein VG755_29530 [Nannocystaceae bacterium]|nr:hypothetical protein [Nannocystaceae bacterium]
MTHTRIAFAVVLGLALACKRWDFHCDDDEQCVSDDVLGFCEAEGFCSYPDSTCPSGARWGPQAGPHANDCVEESSESSSSSSSSAAGTSSSSDTSSSSSG